MNSRDYKIFRSGNCYHIFNRGNNKEVIFKDHQDYLNFLKRLKLVLGLAGVSKVLFAKGQRAPLTALAVGRIRIQPFPPGLFSVICYCLMPNHFHFLIRQDADIPIDKLISKICTSYAKYFNLKYDHIGNVFQDRFKAKLVENDKYLKYLSAYIHNNPKEPLTWEYSSLPDYVSGRQGKICDKALLLGMFNNNPKEYRNFVLGFSREQAGEIKDLLFED
jgi:putative transposase